MIRATETALRKFFGIGWVLTGLVLQPLFEAGAQTVEESRPEVYDASSVAVEKTNWVAEVSRETDPAKRIETVELIHQRIPVALRRKDGKLRPFVEIRALLKDSGSKVFIEDRDTLYPVTLKDGGMFVVFVYLNSIKSELNLQVLGSDGQTKKTEKFMVYAPDVQEYKIGKPWGLLVISPGGAVLRYKQTNFGDYASINGLVSATYESEPVFGKFSLAGDFALTLWTVRSSPTDTAPQLLGVHAHVLYALREPKSRFQVHPMLGLQYFTLFSNGSQLGFANLIAGGVGTKLRYEFSDRARLTLQGFYAPLKGVFSLKDFGTETSLTASYKLENNHRVELGAVYSRQAFQASDITRVDLGAISIRLGYSL